MISKLLGKNKTINSIIFDNLYPLTDEEILKEFISIGKAMYNGKMECDNSIDHTYYKHVKLNNSSISFVLRKKENKAVFSLGVIFFLDSNSLYSKIILTNNFDIISCSKNVKNILKIIEDEEDKRNS